MLLIALALAAPYIYQRFHKSKAINLTGFNAAVARLKQNAIADSTKAAIKSEHLSNFNPNQLPVEQWQKIGLREQQIQVIKNYEAKGGRFYSKQDLKKIYVISADDYRKLAPHINLPDKEPRTEKTNAVVELNAATEKSLTQIKGIGEGWAKSIIRYRDRLGGFYKKEQLKEIYGMDKFTYADLAPYVKIDAGRIVKISINTATPNDLLVYPYLNFKQKNAIIEYRNQHGNYTRLADLLNIPIIDAQILRKIEPYISFKW